MFVPTTQSPCVKVCIIGAEQLCTGCRRTLNEIARWSTMSAADRIAVNQRVGFESNDRNR